MTHRSTVGPLRVADAWVYLHTNDESFADVLAWCFKDLARADLPAGTANTTHHFEVDHEESPWPHWTLKRDGETRQHALDEGYVLFHVQWELNQIVLERRFTTIHAAAVEVDGSCVILCGASMSGKTTLAGWMAVHGAGYVADEIVSLTDEGSALSYHRPLGLRHGGPLEPLISRPASLDNRFEAYEMVVPVSSLGGVTLTDDPLPVSAVVFPQYDPNSTPDIQPVLKSVAFDRLCSNLPGLARHHRPVFLQAEALIRRVPTFDLRISDAGIADEMLRSAVGSAPQPRGCMS